MKFSARNTTLLVLACLLSLGMRATGVHLHLCLDGQETQQLHWSDSGVHNDEDHASGNHSDVDLNLVADALLKTAKSGFDLPVLLVAIFGLFALLHGVHPPSVRAPPVSFNGASRHFQPPLRAPPL